MEKHLDRHAIDALIQRYAEEEEPRERAAWKRAEKRRVGRPALDNGSEESPKVTLRLPRSLNERVTQLADDENITRSDVVRHALERYLAAQ